ncbi:hypothetical protein TSUD_418360, partial [Trifolium subterraneum]
KKGKQSQIAPGKSATNPQPNSPRVTENDALLDALRETIRTVNEQNNRIRALEDGQRQILGYIKPPSPPRRAERSESPPARRAGTSQRRPVLERVQPQVQKRNRTPPREDSVARTNKRGKAAALFEQRPKSPPRRKEILLGGMAQGSRGDDYQNRRENSPRREETPTHSPGWSDDEVYKGPLSRQIMDLELPRALQKPPQLGKYDGLTDPDIHIQNIDAILNYQAVRGGIKCRIFPTTLVEGAMAWYRSLPQGSITSWKDLCKQFTSHFTASRKHPKTEANLEAVRQGPNETLRSYIERFNKEAVQVDVTDDMKKYLMRKNLRDGTKFKEMVAIEKPATWDEILHKAQAYMHRHSKQEHKEEKKLRKDKAEGDAASRDILRPIPDGDFELIPLGEDPSRNLKIGKDVPDLARKQLVACLKDNADLFAWSASEMPSLDPNIACHQLTVDEAASAVVQRRRRQSPEKVEAAKKAVKDLLEANFISEAKYTTWLSNVVLVKKSNGKWRMCVDYTDLNRACPKDAYPLPCIDRLVDNSS